MYDFLGLGIWALFFLVPPAIGFIVARRAPSMARWKAALLAAAPGTVITASFTVWLHFTSDMTQIPDCEPPNCSMASLWVMAMYGITALITVIGLVTGFVGHLVGANTGADKGE